MEGKKFSVTNVALGCAGLGVAFLLFCYKGESGMFYDSAYSKTAAGKIELKTVPSSVILTARGEKNDYFSSSNRSFGKLFGYINSHKVSMTTPVEGHIDTNEMRFYVGSKDQKKDLKTTTKVTVGNTEEQLVLAIGIRGSYTRERFLHGKEQLAQWLDAHPEYTVDGSYYAVYWNSPFCPGFLKRSEVHVPVKKIPQ